MTKQEEILKHYNQLIKMNVEEIQIWKRGSWKHKQYQIFICKKHIKFYKTMKQKIENGFLKT